MQIRMWIQLNSCQVLNIMNATMLNMSSRAARMQSKLKLWQYYAPSTAVNTSQYGSMRTVIISLSAAPQETLTMYTLPLWGNMLHLLSQFWGNVKTNVKVSDTEISVHTVLGLSAQDGWDASCSHGETNTASLKHPSISNGPETREGCLLKLVH